MQKAYAAKSTGSEEVCDLTLRSPSAPGSPHLHKGVIAARASVLWRRERTACAEDSGEPRPTQCK